MIILTFQSQGETSSNFREVENEGVDSDSSKSGKQTKSGSIENVNISQEQPDRILKRRRTHNSDDTDGEPMAKLDKLDEAEDSEENVSTVSLFGSLIKVAAAMNPKQFELPSELIEPITFPGNFLFFKITC